MFPILNMFEIVTKMEELERIKDLLQILLPFYTLIKLQLNHYKLSIK